MSDSSMVNNMASMATSVTGMRVQSQLSTAILKQTMDTQKIVAEGIIKMIQATPSPDPAIGRSMDLFA